MGTGGGIRNVARLLESGPDDPVVILNGDILSGHDLARQVAAHRASGAEVSLHLTEVEDARAFGCVPTDDSGRVTAFLEKMPNPVTNRINAGCYVFRRSVDRRDPGRPAGVGGARDVPRAGGRRRAGARARRRGVLARPRHAGRLRPRVAATSCSGCWSSPALPGPDRGVGCCCPGAEVADDAVRDRRYGGRGRRAGSLPVPRSTAACCSTAPVVGAGAVVRDSVVGRARPWGAGAVAGRRAWSGDGADVGDGNELAARRAGLGRRAHPAVRDPLHPGRAQPPRSDSSGLAGQAALGSGESVDGNFFMNVFDRPTADLAAELDVAVRRAPVRHADVLAGRERAVGVVPRRDDELAAGVRPRRDAGAGREVLERRELARP